MIKCKNFSLALQHLFEFKLIPIIFKLPDNYTDLLIQGYDLVMKINAQLHLKNQYLYTAGFLVYYSLSGDFNVIRNKKNIKIYEFVCTESLKMSNTDAGIVCSILDNISKCILNFLEFDPLKMAEVIRDTKEYYDLCVLLSGFVHFSDVVEAREGINRVMELIKLSRIEDFWNEKPLLNVKFI